MQCSSKVCVTGKSLLSDTVALSGYLPHHRFAEKLHSESGSRILYEILCHQTKVLTALEKFNEALKCVDEATALGYNPIQILLLRAQTYATMGDYPQSQAVCNEALDKCGNLERGNDEISQLPSISPIVLGVVDRRVANPSTVFV